MAHRGKNCLKCGGAFHACGSCGFHDDWMYDYCSQQCYMLSDEKGAVLRTSKDIAIGVMPEVIPLLLTALNEWDDEKLVDLRDALLARLRAECEAA